MSIRHYSVFLCLGLFMVATANAAPPAKPRVWTDQQGRQVTGRLLRVDDQNVQIEVDGAPVLIPIDQLSDDDQRFVTGAAPSTTPGAANSEPPPLAQPRFWTINGRQIGAQWSGADDAGFVLKTPSGEMRVAYEAVTNPDDAAEAARLLKQSGRADLAEVVVAAYERNTGNKLSATDDKKSATDDFGEPAPDSEDEMPEREKPKITTAEEAFAANEATASTTDQTARENFQRTALLGGLAIFVVIAAAIGIGWMMMQKK